MICVSFNKSSKQTNAPGDSEFSGGKGSFNLCKDKLLTFITAFKYVEEYTQNWMRPYALTFRCSSGRRIQEASSE